MRHLIFHELLVFLTQSYLIIYYRMKINFFERLVFLNVIKLYYLTELAHSTLLSKYLEYLGHYALQS